ncbi:MAG: hypothetical protein IJT27_01695 [Clostridia bacterium]|nr:hypothetical protein [Clostridia bacterium]
MRFQKENFDNAVVLNIGNCGDIVYATEEGGWCVPLYSKDGPGKKF